MKTYSNIPTNIISGFLGAGKTTAIQFLLKQKPASETWAVIVNEFGQIGIDGAILKNDDVAIKEIPGGCLCCVGSQALSVGLNQVIRTVKPQRILIEPTGLGHPGKLIESLTSGFYQSVLDLKAIINLVDARQLKDDRYFNNQTFIDQSNFADILIGSKLDTYSDKDKNYFSDYAMAFSPGKLKVALVELGKLQLDWLNLTRLPDRSACFPDLHSAAQSHFHDGHEESCAVITNNQNWLMLENHANGYFSIGWKIDKAFKFNHKKLTGFVNELIDAGGVERVKGVLHTGNGWISVNFTQNERPILACTAGSYSMIEFILSEQFDYKQLNLKLADCLS